MKPLFVALLVLSALKGYGQVETVTYEPVFSAVTLGGVVSDQNGDALTGARVARCERGWRRELEVVTADAEGHFSFSSRKKNTTYYLEFSFPRFNPVRIRVRIRSRHGTKQELSIKLPVAT